MHYQTTVSTKICRASLLVLEVYLRELSCVKIVVIDKWTIVILCILLIPNYNRHTMRWRLVRRNELIPLVDLPGINSGNESHLNYCDKMSLSASCTLN